MGFLYYVTDTKEIVYDNTKSFVIQHPIVQSKYLVHACLEGPETGIYYRGQCSITNNSHIEILLPDYAKCIGTDFTVHITKKYTGKESFGLTYEVTDVVDGKFTVFGANGSFYWSVIG